MAGHDFRGHAVLRATTRNFSIAKLSFPALCSIVIFTHLVESTFVDYENHMNIQLLTAEIDALKNQAAAAVAAGRLRLQEESRSARGTIRLLHGSCRGWLWRALHGFKKSIHSKHD